MIIHLLNLYLIFFRLLSYWVLAGRIVDTGYLYELWSLGQQIVCMIIKNHMCSVSSRGNPRETFHLNHDLICFILYLFINYSALEFNVIRYNMTIAEVFYKCSFDYGLWHFGAVYGCGFCSKVL